MTNSNPQNPEEHLESQGADAFVLELERFSGPLDLLLHLIKQHEMDIFDIPIAEVTKKYLAYLDLLRELNLDIAGDFLVMAATLAHIKSKMLLPPSEEDEAEDEEDENDPREELVRRLLEYQKYRQAAEQLDTLPRLGRDTFLHPPEKIPAEKTGEVDIEDVSVFQLIEVFQEILDRNKLYTPHQVELETVKVEDKIREILGFLRNSSRITFRALFAGVQSRPQIVGMFLGILELAKLRILRLYQAPGDGEIYLSKREEAPTDEEIMKRIILDAGQESATAVQGELFGDEPNGSET